MNWTQFLLSLAAVYSLYYLLNVSFDLLRSRGQPTEDGNQDELVFSEDQQPRQVYTDQPTAGASQSSDTVPKSRQAISSGPLQTTGGVSLKQLFSLAQSDLIEYTKAIPY